MRCPFGPPATAQPPRAPAQQSRASALPTVEPHAALHPAAQPQQINPERYTMPRVGPASPQPAAPQRSWYQIPEEEPTAKQEAFLPANSRTATGEAASISADKKTLMDLIQVQFYQRSSSLRRLNGSPHAMLTPSLRAQRLAQSTTNAFRQPTVMPEHLHWEQSSPTSQAIKTWAVDLYSSTKRDDMDGRLVDAEHKRLTLKASGPSRSKRRSMRSAALPSTVGLAQARSMWLGCGLNEQEVDALQRVADKPNMQRIVDPLCLTQTHVMLSSHVGDVAARKVLVSAPRLLRYHAERLDGNLKGLFRLLGDDVATAVLLAQPYCITLKPDRMQRAVRALETYTSDVLRTVVKVKTAIMSPPERLHSNYELLVEEIGSDAVQALLAKPDRGGIAILTMTPRRVIACGRVLKRAFPGLDLAKLLTLFPRLATLFHVLPRKAAMLSHVLRLPENVQEKFIESMCSEANAGRIMSASLRVLQRVEYLAEFHPQNSRNGVLSVVVNSSLFHKSFPEFQAWQDGLDCARASADDIAGAAVDSTSS